MPRDTIVTNDMHLALRKAFDKKYKELWKSHLNEYIYEETARSSAPSFYMTYNEAKRVIHAFESGKLRYRSRELISKRDRDFVHAFRKFMSEHRGCLKSYAINQVINSPAPQFYIRGDAVAAIVSGRENK